MLENFKLSDLKGCKTKEFVKRFSELLLLLQENGCRTANGQRKVSWEETVLFSTDSKRNALSLLLLECWQKESEITLTRRVDFATYRWEHVDDSSEHASAEFNINSGKWLVKHWHSNEEIYEAFLPLEFWKYLLQQSGLIEKVLEEMFRT